MKINAVAVNSQFVHSNLALYYLRENTPSHMDFSMAEYTINDPLTEIFYDITAEDWDILAFSVYIWNKEVIQKLLPLIRGVCPNTVIILGGPEPTYAPKDFPEGDYIVYGALEPTWEPLLLSLEAGEVPDLLGIQGIPQFAPDWKFPYRSEDLPVFAHRLVYYETSRGCPYQCGFCLSSAEKSTGFLPMERVKEELTFFLDAAIPVVKLVDRTFNYPKERGKEIIRFLLEHYKPHMTFHFELKGELIDEEMLALFAAAPKDFFQVEIGIQTLNEQALSASKRKNQWEKTKEVYRRLIAMDNIHTHFDLIAGLPFEDYLSFQHSFSEAMSIFPNHMQLGFLKLLPGTVFWQQRDVHGYIAETHPPYEIVENQYISHKELGLLKKIDGYMDRWYNKGGYPTLFRFAMDAYEGSLFSFFLSLAESDKEPPEAISALLPEKEVMWQQLSRFDSFMSGRKVHVTLEEDKLVHRFLKSEENIEIYLPDYWGMSPREIYKRIRIGAFPVAFVEEGKRIVGVEEGYCHVLFDYKEKGNAKKTKTITEFMLLSW